jgi:hypothetical protein
MSHTIQQHFFYRKFKNTKNLPFQRLKRLPPPPPPSHNTHVSAWICKLSTRSVLEIGRAPWALEKLQ